VSGFRIYAIDRKNITGGFTVSDHRSQAPFRLSPTEAAVWVDGYVTIVPRPHLVHAVSSHVRWCRANGIPATAVVHLLEVLEGHRRPTVAPGADGVETDLVRTHLTPTEVAERLGVSVKTVRRRVADGSLPAVRVGRALRIPVSAVA
jgi:excisionase family DNA binding protein